MLGITNNTIYQLVGSSAIQGITNNTTYQLIGSSAIQGIPNITKNQSISSSITSHYVLPCHDSSQKYIANTLHKGRTFTSCPLLRGNKYTLSLQGKQFVLCSEDEFTSLYHRLLLFERPCSTAACHAVRVMQIYYLHCRGGERERTH